jgi:hypothetical protein
MPPGRPIITQRRRRMNHRSQVLKDNIALLHRVGVRVVVGSDHAETSLAEVMQLAGFISSTT